MPRRSSYNTITKQQACIQFKKIHETIENHMNTLLNELKQAEVAYNLTNYLNQTIDSNKTTALKYIINLSEQLIHNDTNSHNDNRKKITYIITTTLTYLQLGDNTLLDHLDKQALINIFSCSVDYILVIKKQILNSNDKTTLLQELSTLQQLTIETIIFILKYDITHDLLNIIWQTLDNLLKEDTNTSQSNHIEFYKALYTSYNKQKLNISIIQLFMVYKIKYIEYSNCPNLIKLIIPCTKQSETTEEYLSNQVVVDCIQQLVNREDNALKRLLYNNTEFPDNFVIIGGHLLNWVQHIEDIGLATNDNLSCLFKCVEIVIYYCQTINQPSLIENLYKQSSAIITKLVQYTDSTLNLYTLRAITNQLHQNLPFDHSIHTHKPSTYKNTTHLLATTLHRTYVLASKETNNTQQQQQTNTKELLEIIRTFVSEMENFEQTRQCQLIQALKDTENKSNIKEKEIQELIITLVIINGNITLCLKKFQYQFLNEEDIVTLLQYINLYMKMLYARTREQIVILSQCNPELNLNISDLSNNLIFLLLLATKKMVAKKCLEKYQMQLLDSINTFNRLTSSHSNQTQNNNYLLAHTLSIGYTPELDQTIIPTLIKVTTQNQSPHFDDLALPIHKKSIDIFNHNYMFYYKTVELCLKGEEEINKLINIEPKTNLRPIPKTLIEILIQHSYNPIILENLIAIKINKQTSVNYELILKEVLLKELNSHEYKNLQHIFDLAIQHNNILALGYIYEIVNDKYESAQTVTATDDAACAISQEHSYTVNIRKWLSELTTPTSQEFQNPIEKKLDIINEKSVDQMIQILCHIYNLYILPNQPQLMQNDDIDIKNIKENITKLLNTLNFLGLRWNAHNEHIYILHYLMIKQDNSAIFELTKAIIENIETRLSIIENFLSKNRTLLGTEYQFIYNNITLIKRRFYTILKQKSINYSEVSRDRKPKLNLISQTSSQDWPLNPDMNLDFPREETTELQSTHQLFSISSSHLSSETSNIFSQEESSPIRRPNTLFIPNPTTYPTQSHPQSLLYNYNDDNELSKDNFTILEMLTHQTTLPRIDHLTVPIIKSLVTIDTSLNAIDSYLTTDDNENDDENDLLSLKMSAYIPKLSPPTPWLYNLTVLHHACYRPIALQNLIIEIIELFKKTKTTEYNLIICDDNINYKLIENIAIAIILINTKLISIDQQAHYNEVLPTQEEQSSPLQQKFTMKPQQLITIRQKSIHAHNLLSTIENFFTLLTPNNNLPNPNNITPTQHYTIKITFIRNLYLHLLTMSSTTETLITNDSDENTQTILYHTIIRNINILDHEHYRTEQTLSDLLDILEKCITSISHPGRVITDMHYKIINTLTEKIISLAKYHHTQTKQQYNEKIKKLLINVLKLDDSYNSRKYKILILKLILNIQIKFEIQIDQNAFILPPKSYNYSIDSYTALLETASDLDLIKPYKDTQGHHPIIQQDGTICTAVTLHREIEKIRTADTDDDTQNTKPPITIIIISLIRQGVINIFMNVADLDTTITDHIHNNTSIATILANFTKSSGLEYVRDFSLSKYATAIHIYGITNFIVKEYYIQKHNYLLQNSETTQNINTTTTRGYNLLFPNITKPLNKISAPNQNNQLSSFDFHILMPISIQITDYTKAYYDFHFKNTMKYLQSTTDDNPNTLEIQDYIIYMIALSNNEEGQQPELQQLSYQGTIQTLTSDVNLENIFVIIRKLKKLIKETDNPQKSQTTKLKQLLATNLIVIIKSISGLCQNIETTEKLTSPTSPIYPRIPNSPTYLTTTQHKNTQQIYKTLTYTILNIVEHDIDIIYMQTHNQETVIGTMIENFHNLYTLEPNFFTKLDEQNKQIILKTIKQKPLPQMPMITQLVQSLQIQLPYIEQILVNTLLMHEVAIPDTDLAIILESRPNLAIKANETLPESTIFLRKSTKNNTLLEYLFNYTLKMTAHTDPTVADETLKLYQQSMLNTALIISTQTNLNTNLVALKPVTDKNTLITNIIQFACRHYTTVKNIPNTIFIVNQDVDIFSATKTILTNCIINKEMRNQIDFDADHIINSTIINTITQNFGTAIPLDVQYNTLTITTLILQIMKLQINDNKNSQNFIEFGSVFIEKFVKLILNTYIPRYQASFRRHIMINIFCNMMQFRNDISEQKKIAFFIKFILSIPTTDTQPRLEWINILAAQQQQQHITIILRKLNETAEHKNFMKMFRKIVKIQFNIDLDSDSNDTNNQCLTLQTQIHNAAQKATKMDSRFQKLILYQLTTHQALIEHEMIINTIYKLAAIIPMSNIDFDSLYERHREQNSESSVFATAYSAFKQAISMKANLETDKVLLILNDTISEAIGATAGAAAMTDDITKIEDILYQNTLKHSEQPAPKHDKKSKPSPKIQKALYTKLFPIIEQICATYTTFPSYNKANIALEVVKLSENIGCHHLTEETTQNDILLFQICQKFGSSEINRLMITTGN